MQRIRSVRNDGVSLYYRDGTQWTAVPAWAMFFDAIGAAMASQPDADGCRMAVITVPTRAYAAAITAFGYIKQRRQDSPSIEASAHFARIANLEPGSPVIYRPGERGARLGKARFLCIEETDADRYIVLQTSTNTIYKAPYKFALRIQPAMNELKNLPAKERLNEVSGKAGLAAAFFDAEQLSVFLDESNVDCLVVGNKTVFRSELTNTDFMASLQGDRKTPGTLQDVVRSRPFTSGPAGIHSDIVSESARVANGSARPRLVIFDGGRGFLRFQRSWPEADKLIILERGDRRADEVSVVVERLFARRISQKSPMTMKSVPVGIECVVFQVRRSQ